ncbi:hypothetical protein [Acidovorax sp. SUPP3334]|uniref:hypothetical protein n=1 Tax=Acidovorax sp. SUPP3334 TaxID=2920881 RepID=UPI0023DE47CC|nr:hypothetical protein [Acidovorax sp. SUPP3334]GKT25578.1 hypothetical protein AVHM3334_18365 [Acidovorax sp. SUPP3334]
MSAAATARRFIVRCWFGLLCTLLGLVPLLVLLVGWPLLRLLGCEGNEGSGMQCAGAPGLSDAAYTVLMVGAWGSMFTLPSALGLYVCGAVVRWVMRSPMQR